DCSRPLNLLECIAEPARLQRSAGSVGFRIKEKDHVLAAIVFESYRLAFFVGKRELRGFIINFHGFSVLITSIMNLYSRRKFLDGRGVLEDRLVGCGSHRRRPLCATPRPA